MNTESADIEGDRELSVLDRWIVAEFQKTAAAVNRAMDTHRFDLASKAIYEFVWDEFCDWYLELSKPILNSKTSPEATIRGTRHTLLTVLESTLRLAHPFLPFITEEIWQQIPGSIRGPGTTIMLEQYPEPEAGLIDEKAIKDVAWIKKVVTGVRNIRGEMDISIAKAIPILFHNGDDADKRCLEAYRDLLSFLVNPEELTMLPNDASLPVSSTYLVGEMQLLVPMSGLIDKDAEVSRLDKEIDRKEKEKQRADGKVNNPNFVEKAPEAVVQKERDKVIELSSAIEKLQQQKLRIESL
jgi:valyl-tRNA synthetase